MPGLQEGWLPGTMAAMQSKAATVAEYLKELPPERRAAIEEVRKVVLRNLDRGFAEGMQYGMIGWFVPHSLYPAGYHCDPRQPLPFASLASQKNHMALYMMGLYTGGEEKRFRARWAKTGKKLDMGKCCIRFRKLADLALDVIGEEIAGITAKAHIEQYERARRQRPVMRKAAVRRKAAGRTAKKRGRKPAKKP